MNTRAINGTDAHRAVAFSFLILVAFTLFSHNADARNCRMMKPPMYMGMPMMAPQHHKLPKVMRHGGHIPGMQAGPDVIAVVRQAGSFSTLLAALEKAGLTGLLEGEGPYTLFAPTETAFESLPQGALDELLADRAKLTALLKYHVLPGRVSAADILTSGTLDTASDQTLPTASLSVIRADVRARNGVVHVVDKVLLPTE